MALTARSYCSGYGGLEMAVRAALGSFEVLSHSDIKPASERLLAYRYPDIPNLGDMREIDYAALEPTDLMIGSWPCQPHSHAGRKLGEDDPRDLWPEYLRAIDAHRPTIFFGENVARIASNGELRRVIRSLAQRGYVGSWRCQRASDVGACHKRDRCFVVAVAADALGETGWLTGHAEQGDRAGATGLRVAEPGRRDHGAVALLPTPCARDWREGADFVARPEKIKLTHTIKHLHESGLLPTPSVADIRRGHSDVNRTARGGGRTMAEEALLIPKHWGRYAEAIARHTATFGRPAPDPTQPAFKGDGRQLSARFVEWMMMLPEGHVTDVPREVLVDSPRQSERNLMLSLLGDGVVPAQGGAAFSFLLGHMAQRLAVAA
jgi:DNA (cytosine-5)-methyltransferase 1